MAAESKRMSSIGIQLKIDEQVISGLTDIPDMGATPEKLDVTTLADSIRQYTNGVRDYGDLEFTFIYEKGADGNYAILHAKEDKVVACEVVFPDGATFAFSGTLSLRIAGVGVNAAITFVAAIALESDVEYTAGA